MVDATTHLRRARPGVRTPQVDVAFFRGGERKAAFGTALGHDEGTLGAVAQFDHRTEHLGNDIAGLAQYDRVADQHALQLDDVLIVERRLTHDAARDARRLHDGERSRTAGAADRDDDVEQLGVDLLGRVLVGDRPARCAAGRSELVVQREFVDLDHDPVDLVLDVVAVAPVVLDELIRRRRGVGDLEVLARRQSPRGQEGVDPALRRNRRIGPRSDAVHRHSQARQPLVNSVELPFVLALGLLPERAARGVARVREQAVAHLLLVCVERLEIGDVEEHLAPHFDQGGVTCAGKPMRDAADPQHILGDVFAHPTVAARGSRDESAVLVSQ